ncbi:MAG: peptidoglycan DD-metalloendopeptidase family protein [Oscillospiraceae bacterium]|nr:peptidoglycan DD-metalloendopeptidase family protein [Oscillospiraceae bacterium]
MLKTKIIKKAVVFLISLALILPPLSAGMMLMNKIDASTISDLRNQIKNQETLIANNANQRRELEGKIAAAKREQNQDFETKEFYDRLMTNIQEAVLMEEGRLELLEEYLTLTENVIEDKQADYEQNLDLFLDLLKFTYERGSAGYLELFLRADDLSSLLTQIDRMAAVTNYTKDILNSLQDDKTEIEQARETYKELSTQGEQYKIKLNENNAELKSRQDEIEQYIQTRSSDIAAMEARQKILDQDSQSIENDIKRITAEIQAKQAAEQRVYVGGSMGWPLELGFKTITSPYGQRIHPLTKRSEFHRGVDISGPGINGTNIYAANDGTVIISQYSGSYGYYIVIDHGAGHTTLYSHASTLLKKANDTVKRGDVIARVGSTGWSTGPHLHFEIAINGETQNPLNGWIVIP